MQELIREPINTNLLQRYIDEWLSHVNTTHNWKRLHQILSNLLTGVISATDTHIGSTNLTLTSNRLLSGDGNNFSIEDLGYFTVISNNDMIFGTSANFNTIGASYYINVTGDYILNLPSATNAPVGAPLLNQTFGVGDVEFANYGFPTSLSGMDNGKMLVYNSTINQFVTQSLGVVTNIYNSDGALSSNRQLTGDEHNLTFGLPDDDLNATSDIPIFTVNAGNIIFNAGAEIQLNTLEGESVLISTAGLGIFTDSIFFGGESLGLPANPTPQMFLVLDGAINTGNLSVSTVAEMQTALGLALTSGYVAFGNGTGITGEANLFYNATDDRLGVGGTPDRTLHIKASDAVTNAVTYIEKLSHLTSGTAATSFGLGIEYELENASGTNRVAATQEFTWSDATNATEDTTYMLKLMTAGTLTNTLTLTSAGLLTLTGGIVANGAFQTLAASAVNSCFHVIGSNQGVNNSSTYTFLGANSSYRSAFGGAATGSPSNNTNYAAVIINTIGINVSSSGTNPLFTNFAVKPLTINSAAGTLTNAATVYIEGPATGTGIPLPIIMLYG